MIGPTAAEVVWKPSWMDVISCTLPSGPGIGEGANWLFLQHQCQLLSNEIFHVAAA